MNIPNILTLIRIASIPFCVYFYFSGLEWGPFISGLIFALAAVTDWFDGYLARKLNQMSAFGAFIDPVADKLFVAVALVVLVAGHSGFELYNTLVISISTIIIIGREITISALREWMAEQGKRAAVKVSYIGKVKTAVQMVAIGTLLSQTMPVSNWVIDLGYLLLVISAILSLWSMVVYLKAAWSSLMEES